MYWMLLFTLIYTIGFTVLERAGHRHYHIIHTWLDDQIPFCEYFIVPYLLWFGFMTVGVGWFVLKCSDIREYYRLITVLMMGMTIFLVVSAVYPNKLDLRPEMVNTDNIFGMLCAFLYRTDTPTNVLPSIHVYNTLVLCYAVTGNRELRKRPIVVITADVIGASIVLSTMFLKQHSVIDVSLGIVMSVLLQMAGDRIFDTGAEREKALAARTSFSSERRTAN